jgi:hypothetical protein
MIIAMSSPRKTRRPERSLLRQARDWRVELGLLLGFTTLIMLCSSVPVYVFLPVGLVALAALIWKREVVSSWLLELLHTARFRRKLKRASRDAGFGEIYVDKVITTLPGEWAHVRTPRGVAAGELERYSDKLANCLSVTDVRVIRDRQQPHSRAILSVIERDPFEMMDALKWPLIDSETVSIRQGIPFGLDEYGRVVNARLLSRNLILGGAPDAGKSVALRPFAAATVLDPMAKLWMMDAKPNAVEFGMWEGAAHDIVRGRDLPHAVEMFRKLSERVERRYYEISARGLEFVADDMEVDVLMIDEMPQFMRIFEDDTKEQQSAVKTIRGAVWKLIALGRAAGMVTIISAQKPTADIVPSESRDLIDHKFALHCNTKPMSDAILGQGAGEEGIPSAAEIPTGQPGVGIYVGDDGPRKMRTFFIPRAEALEVVSRVTSRKLDDELSTLTAS